MVVAQRLERLDGGGVLLGSDRGLPLGGGFPTDSQTQQADPCRIETLRTGGGVWCWCVVHDWQRRLSVGAAPVACPFGEGKW